MRRKGELSPSGIDKGWPYQIALHADLAGGKNYEATHRVSAELGACSRGHSVRWEGEEYHVFCFAMPEAAQAFQNRCGGEPFNPKDRGKGAHWYRWNKPQRPESYSSRLKQNHQ